MKPITLQLNNTNKAAAIKLTIGAFIGGGLLILALGTAPGTSLAEEPTPMPTATVAPMTVGQPMMLTDAAGNTIMIMQGSTFYIFPAVPVTPTPKP